MWYWIKKRICSTEDYFKKGGFWILDSCVLTECYCNEFSPSSLSACQRLSGRRQQQAPPSCLLGLLGSAILTILAFLWPDSCYYSASAPYLPVRQRQLPFYSWVYAHNKNHPVKGHLPIGGSKSLLSSSKYFSHQPHCSSSSLQPMNPAFQFY